MPYCRKTQSLWIVLVALLVVSRAPAAQDFELPNATNSAKFAVIGDNGTGERQQFEVAAQMLRVHETFPYSFVIMLGDNIYGGQKAADLVRKFETPYKPLLDSGVKFFASLGNHDDQNNRFYPLWNMNGERYYTYKQADVRFFVLDSDYMDPKQLAWLEQQLRDSTDRWKIAYFHHPLYSSAGRHGSEVDLRLVLEPLFLKYGMNAVFSGHDHIYERLKPQKGIYYFVSGSAGQLRRGDLKRTAMTEVGFDQDQSFMVVEIGGDVLSFKTVSRTGRIVDSGSLRRQAQAPAK
jgi:3',5'-cyclic AMP phosphodiesterase CpdA